MIKENQDMKQIEDIKILVVGDIMLDKYTVGEVNRISPESPVPIVEVIEEYFTLGGCGNVVRNIRELGAQVDCLASIGNDVEGLEIKNKLKEIGAKDLTCIDSKTTTLKERIIAEHRSVQMLRIDREVKDKVDSDLAIKIFETKSNNDYDMVIVSDYAKGMITYELMKYLKENVKAKIIIDPKPQNGSMYNDVYMITPNEQEWNIMQLSSAYILNNVRYILQTLGSKGMRLIDGKDVAEIKAVPVEIYNVSGCGDVVVATISVCLSLGFSPIISARIANKCAGYTATLPGTSIIPKEKFEKYKKENKTQYTP